MKATSFFKMAGVVGAITVLAIAVGTGMQPKAQAQADVEVPADIDDEACIAAGFHSFYMLQNIEFSPDQLEKMFELERLASDASEALMASFPTEVELDGGYSFVNKPGAEITPEVQAAMDAAAAAMPTGEARKAAVAALNEEFAQYGEFSLFEEVLLTPERREEMRQLNKDFDAQYISVLTPEQQEQYQKNLETQSKIDEACGIVRVDPITYGFYR